MRAVVSGSSLPHLSRILHTLDRCGAETLTLAFQPGTATITALSPPRSVYARIELSSAGFFEVYEAISAGQVEPAVCSVLVKSVLGIFKTAAPTTALDASNRSVGSAGGMARVEIRVVDPSLFHPSTAPAASSSSTAGIVTSDASSASCRLVVKVSCDDHGTQKIHRVVFASSSEQQDTAEGTHANPNHHHPVRVRYDVAAAVADPSLAKFRVMGNVAAEWLTLFHPRLDELTIILERVKNTDTVQSGIDIDSGEVRMRLVSHKGNRLVVNGRPSMRTELVVSPDELESIHLPASPEGSPDEVEVLAQQTFGLKSFKALVHLAETTLGCVHAVMNAPGSPIVFIVEPMVPVLRAEFVLATFAASATAQAAEHTAATVTRQQLVPTAHSAVSYEYSGHAATAVVRETGPTGTPILQSQDAMGEDAEDVHDDGRPFANLSRKRPMADNDNVLAERREASYRGSYVATLTAAPSAEDEMFPPTDDEEVVGFESDEDRVAPTPRPSKSTILFPRMGR